MRMADDGGWMDGWVPLQGREGAEGEKRRQAAKVEGNMQVGTRKAGSLVLILFTRSIHGD